MVDLLLVGLMASVCAFAVFCMFYAIQTEHRAERNSRAIIDAIDEFRHQTQQSMLKILQALKGENYVGDFGGIEMYTDSAIPPEHVLLYTANNEKRDMDEAANETAS